MSKNGSLDRRAFLAVGATTYAGLAMGSNSAPSHSAPLTGQANASRAPAATKMRKPLVPSPIETDVLVYCATPAGILSAYSVRQAGLSVLVVEPSRWVGGILGAGLKPTQDMPNYDAVGGKTRELMVRLGVDPALAISADEAGLKKVRELTLRMSPRDVREGFLKFIRDHDLEIVFDHRIGRTVKIAGRLQAAVFELAPYDDMGSPPPYAQADDALEIRAKVFIDASYDGELMARAGVSYRVGRESRLDYNEDLAGVLPVGGLAPARASEYQQYADANLTPISPFIEAGNPRSGLVPLVEEDHGKPLGAGDHYIQAYNFRYYVTTDRERLAQIQPPDDYDPAHYELVGRYVVHLRTSAANETDLMRRLSWIFPGWLNAGEYNYQRQSLFTIAPLGISHLYADGDHATKSAVWKAHQDYLRGLHHFLSTDTRIPDAFRRETAALGLDRLHHKETRGWPHQLYIREARRLYGRYTLTLHDVYNQTTVQDSIGLAQYGVDSYPARRIWLERGGRTYVATEGNMFVGGDKGPTNVPYPIPYRAITPHKHECDNLLVPVSFSASHLGYASARMEPTFMILGESAGVAAAQAIHERVSVQDIDMNRFLRELRKRGQKIAF